jgi:glutamate racemase
LIPAAEEAAKYGKVGILGTLGTITSNTFPDEIKKINRKTKVFQNSAPMLVPLIEEGEKVLAVQFIKKYLKPFTNKKLDALVLGCTHYPFYKNEIKKILGKKVKLISQDEIIPKKLKEYFVRHPEVEKKLSKIKQQEF